MKKISRRNFLSICGAMAAVGAMTACGGSSSGSSTAASSTGSAAASAAAGDGTKKIVKVAVMCPMSGQSQQFYAQYQAAIQAASDVNRPLSSRQVKKEKLRHEGLVPVSKGSQAL